MKPHLVEHQSELMQFDAHFNQNKSEHVFVCIYVFVCVYLLCVMHECVCACACMHVCACVYETCGLVASKE